MISLSDNWEADPKNNLLKTSRINQYQKVAWAVAVLLADSGDDLKGRINPMNDHLKA